MRRKGLDVAPYGVGHAPEGEAMGLGGVWKKQIGGTEIPVFCHEALGYRLGECRFSRLRFKDITKAIVDREQDCGRCSDVLAMPSVISSMSHLIASIPLACVPGLLYLL